MTLSAAEKPQSIFDADTVCAMTTETDFLFAKYQSTHRQVLLEGGMKLRQAILQVLPAPRASGSSRRTSREKVADKGDLLVDLRGRGRQEAVENPDRPRESTSQPMYQA